MNQHRAYTPAENDYLRANYATDSRPQILAAVPGRTWSSIQNQASKLGASGRPPVVPLRDRTSWHPANVALLLALYPTGGTAAVVAATGLTATGLTANAVRNQASRLRLRYVAQRPKRAHRPYRPRNTPKVAVVKVARAPRPLPPLPPVKPPRASTPNVNAAMAAKRRAEMPRTTLSEAIARHKALRYGQPEHTAFLRDGLAGWQQWKAAQ